MTTRRIALFAALLLHAAPAAAQGLDGVYLAWRMNMTSSEPTEDYLAFYPDGRVVRDDPDEGMAVPPVWERACRYGECGTYQRSGNAVVVRWRNGGGMRLSVEPGGLLRPDGATQRFRPLAPLDGLAPEGIYGIVGERREMLAGITLSRRGEFREFNMLPYLSWEGPGRVGEGSGRYTIRRNTLELRYTNGPVARLMISVPPGVSPTGDPPTLVIRRTRFAKLR